MTNSMANRPKHYLHTPAESTSSYVKWYEERQVAPKIDFGCVLDEHVIPLHPGDMVGIVARPGHGKSSLMAHWAKRTALNIASRGDWENKCVIYVSWEQPVEELEAFFQSGKTYSSTDLAWGRVDVRKVKEQAIKRVSLPVWMIGYSAMDKKIRKPPLYLDTVLDIINWIKYEHGRDVVLACFDYLQNIPVKGARNKGERVAEATERIKELAMNMSLPILNGVQAGRGADDLPSLKDCQWGDIIGQTLDKLFSIYKPRKNMDIGEQFALPGGHVVTVDDYLLIIKLLKQRMEKGWGMWPFHFEPQKLILRDYTTIDLNEDFKEHI